jgi:hypothetical protein
LRRPGLKVRSQPLIFPEIATWYFVVLVIRMMFSMIETNSSKAKMFALCQAQQAWLPSSRKPYNFFCFGERKAQRICIRISQKILDIFLECVCCVVLGLGVWDCQKQLSI